MKNILALGFFVMVGSGNLVSAPGILNKLEMSRSEKAYVWVQAFNLLANQAVGLMNKFTNHQVKNEQLKQVEQETEKRKQETSAYFIKLYGMPVMAFALMGGMFYTLYKYLNKENKKQITK
jgi:hypothetical protein